MPKVKIKRKSTWIDMTAMCDVAFLLLTFFMLTSNFTKKEPVLVMAPPSVSEIKIPERDIMTILVDKSGHVFFGIDGQANRLMLIEQMASQYKITLTAEEKNKYCVLDLVGNPMSGMKSFLRLPPENRDLPQNNLGIPTDSTNNQLKDWVQAARMINPVARIAIKADQDTPYPKIKAVMKTLQQLDENRYNLITKLEENPQN